MPSASVLHWRNDRMPRMQHIDRQCAASLAAVPSNVHLVDENLRGYVVLLSAHFQGFCRDLYTEAAQVIASKVRPTLRLLAQTQVSALRKLDRGNAHLDNIAADFDRFGLDLKAEVSADPANQVRRQHLVALNQWRNVAAHQGTTLPPGGPLTLATVQAWRTSCDGPATALDGILYNALRRMLRRPPW